MFPAGAEHLSYAWHCPGCAEAYASWKQHRQHQAPAATPHQLVAALRLLDPEAHDALAVWRVWGCRRCRAQALQQGGGYGVVAAAPHDALTDGQALAVEDGRHLKKQAWAGQQQPRRLRINK